jgi:hypothetical protein
MSEPAKPTQWSSEPLSFDKVDLGTSPKPAVCASCKQPIADSYYEVNGLIACPTCHEQLLAVRNSGSESQRFVRALLFGLGGAAAGAAIWMGVIELTHSEFGLVAIAVGLVVGLAVKKGAGGARGPAYQALAMALTYVAITTATIPLLIRSVDKEYTKRHAMAPTAHSSGGDPTSAVSDASLPSHQPGFLGRVFIVALKMPFLTAMDDWIGVIIIGIALFEAWKLNKRVPLRITGPLRVSPMRGAAPA